MISSTLWFAELLLHFIKVKTLETIKTVYHYFIYHYEKAKLLTLSLLESRRWAPDHSQWEIAGHDSLGAVVIPGLQDFLDAQQIKAPEKVYCNWLFIGHVTLFLCPTGKVSSCSWLTVCVSSGRAIGSSAVRRNIKKVGKGGTEKQKIMDILPNDKLREHNLYVENSTECYWEVLKWS